MADMNKLLLYSCVIFDCLTYCKSENKILNEVSDKNQVLKEFSSCVGQLLHANDLNYVTVVNDKNDIAFVTEVINEKKPRLMVSRQYVSPNSTINNKAYILVSDSCEALRGGLVNLTRDVHWNPSAIFIVVIMKVNDKKDINNVFQAMFALNVFDVAIVAQITTVETYITADENNIKEISCNNRNFPIKLSPVKCNDDRIRNKSLIFIVNNTPPYIYYYTNSTSSPKLKGLEDVYLDIAKQFGSFNVTTILNKYTETTGIVLNNFTANGPFGDVQNGRADAITGGYVLVDNRLKVFDFTCAHLSDHLIFVVPKAKTLTKWQAMFSTFSVTTWLLILLSYMSFNLIAIKRNYFGLNRNDRWLTFLICFGHFFGNTHKYKGISTKKWFVTTWALFAWLVNSSFQSNLSSVFTKPVSAHQINSLSEICALEFQLCVSKKSFLFLNLTEDPDLSGMFEKKITVETNTECLQYVSQGGKRVTVVSKSSFDNTKMLFRDSDGNPTLHVLLHPYTYIWRTNYMRRGHPCLEEMRSLELWAIAAGLLDEAKKKLTYAYKLKYPVPPKKSFQAITIYDLSGVCIVYMIGSSMSIVIFLSEILLYHKKTLDSL